MEWSLKCLWKFHYSGKMTTERKSESLSSVMDSEWILFWKCKSPGDVMIALRTEKCLNKDHPEQSAWCIFSTHWDSSCSGGVVDSRQCSTRKTPLKICLCIVDVGQVELWWMNQEHNNSPGVCQLIAGGAGGSSPSPGCLSRLPLHRRRTMRW